MSELRKKIHDDLLEVSSIELGELQHIRDSVETIEFNDNIISAYIVQKGKCYISKGKLIPNQCIAIRKEPHKVLFGKLNTASSVTLK